MTRLLLTPLAWTLARKVCKEHMLFDLILDDEFEHLIPPLSSEENQMLEESLLQNGCRDPLSIWDGTILDGYNRYRICQKHNIPYRTVTIDIDDRDEAINWICSNQMARRNISEETRRYLIGKQYEAAKRIGSRNPSGANQYTQSEVSPRILGKPLQDLRKHGIATLIGQEYHVSHATVEKYGRYARALDYIKTIDSTIVPGILRGSIHIGQDNLIDLSTLSPQEIRSVTSDMPLEAPYHCDRETIIGSLMKNREDSESIDEPMLSPQAKAISVKDMPAFDPDAVIASLTLTIPSWRSSMKRTTSNAKFETVSSEAKAALRQELFSLIRTAKAIMRRIKEERS